MRNLVMPKDHRVAAGSWGESKQRVNIMLTPTATEKVDLVAEEMKLTRSEVLERLIRTHCLSVDVLKSIKGQEIEL